MADDNSVEITFSADVDDLVDGIAIVRSQLSSLMEPVRQLDASTDELRDAFMNALPTGVIAAAAKEFAEFGNQAKTGADQVGTVNTQIRLMQLGLAQQKILLNAAASQFQITQDQKFAMLKAETGKEYNLQFALLQKQRDLLEQGSVQYGKMNNRILLLQAKHDIDMLRLNEQAIAQQQQQWQSSLGVIENAFNSQLRGLLAGTTSWSTAFKNILGDIVIKFIEMCEQMMVKWLAAQIAQTTATTSGAAARAAAEQGAASPGIVANAANAMQAILADAAQAFAGVFAFLAPVMGPAAAGPAAAAQATVSGAAIMDVGTDYVVRGGLALIHSGETIIPAARGSGPYTGAGSGPQVHAPVSISVSALDSQSVSRFFNDNSSHMLRAINDAVRRGAHVGLRAIRA